MKERIRRAVSSRVPRKGIPLGRVPGPRDTSPRLGRLSLIRSLGLYSPVHLRAMAFPSWWPSTFRPTMPTTRPPTATPPMFLLPPRLGQGVLTHNFLYHKGFNKHRANPEAVIKDALSKA